MPSDVFRFRTWVFEFLLLGGLFVSDQLIKATFSLDVGRFVRNTGGPWGSDFSGAFFLALVPLVLLGIVFLWLRERDASLRLPLVFLFAGGLGNLTDRIVFGYVRDFRAAAWFPAFNPADVFLTIGAVSLILLVVGSKKRLF